jgi:hypothetical protein
MLSTMPLLQSVTTFDRVVFTGDFLRPSPSRNTPTQHHNIRWLRNLLANQVFAATGLPNTVISWNNENISDGGLNTSDIHRVYQSFGLPLDIRSWAAIHSFDQLPAEVEALLKSLFSQSLVIGFELPPLIEMFLTRHAIPFVSCTIHPVRFLDDLCFAIKSNHSGVAQALWSYRLNEDLINMMAGVQKAASARLFKETVKPRSALFIMQTWYDQSQIKDGKFASPEQYLSDIINTSEKYSELLVKEHPLERHPATEMMRMAIPNMRLVTGNVYSYMSLPEVRSVITLSSSVGVEAPYFGVETHFLLRAPVALRTDEDDPLNYYTGVSNDVLHTDFWRDVLRPLCSVTSADGVRIPDKPNRLRIALRSFWNFNEIDTDVFSSLVRKR